jgi:hypothetical protein
MLLLAPTCNLMVTLFIFSHHTRSSYILKADDAENKEDDIDIGDNVLSMMLREVATLTHLSQRHHAFFRTTLFSWLSQLRFLLQLLPFLVLLPLSLAHAEFSDHNFGDIKISEPLRKITAFYICSSLVSFKLAFSSTTDRTANEGPVRIQ